MSKDRQTATSTYNVTNAVKAILNSIEREREREIISRRFGLYNRRETLEQIGELLGITRERVRQLEKAILTRLQQTSNLPHITETEEVFVANLSKMGNVARTEDLAERIAPTIEHRQAQVAFLASLTPKLAVIEDNDDTHHSVGLSSVHDIPEIKARADKLVNAIGKIGHPLAISELADKLPEYSPEHLEALAGISKHLATLKGKWGLVKWPTVNPKNIRDKIYVVLQETHKPMHFNEIAAAIKNSEFRRRNVTTQAIHNELIKDKRFVLIGRGIYALKEWGYKKGTVADMIAEILHKAGNPLHRDEIVQRVLKQRQVKETTILLNLQGKKQFERVAKATYQLAQE